MGFTSLIMKVFDLSLLFFTLPIAKVFKLSLLIFAVPPVRDYEIGKVRTRPVFLSFFAVVCFGRFYIFLWNFSVIFLGPTLQFTVPFSISFVTMFLPIGNCPAVALLFNELVFFIGNHATVHPPHHPFLL